MQVAVTLIDRIVGSIVTDDGQHTVLTLADIDGQKITLGIPCARLPELINLSARALTDSERVQRQLVITPARAEVTWWTLHTDQTSGDLLLSLTLVQEAASASLCHARWLRY